MDAFFEEKLYQSAKKEIVTLASRDLATDLIKNSIAFKELINENKKNQKSKQDKDLIRKLYPYI